MLRRSVATLVVFFLVVSTLLAADKIVKGTLIKVEMKKQQLFLQDRRRQKGVSVNAKTKFIGPRGGVSDAGIKDDRLKPGTPLELVVAGNNKTLREVHLPERKGPSPIKPGNLPRVRRGPNRAHVSKGTGGRFFYSVGRGCVTEWESPEFRQIPKGGIHCNSPP